MSPADALSAPWQPMMPNPATHTASGQHSVEEKPVVAMVKQPARPSEQQDQHPRRPSRPSRNTVKMAAIVPPQCSTPLVSDDLLGATGAQLQQGGDPAVQEMHRQQHAANISHSIGVVTRSPGANRSAESAALPARPRSAKHGVRP